MKQKFQLFLFGSSLPDTTVLNIGWFLFRLHIGLSLAIHAGLPKMYTMAAPGWFNEQVAGLGFTFPSPAFWATLASWGEFIGGICIALGLLTRFSALQLAFQFFVISFLWYDNPEPLTGMYFQQTLFWGYVLVLFAGGGRFSLDHLIARRIKLRMPLNIRAIAAILLLCSTAFSGMAQPASGKKISITDFTPLRGEWKGSLTYLDYSSNQLVTLPANTKFEMVSDSSFDQFIYYTSEPDKNDGTRYTIKENGRQLNDMKLLTRRKNTDGSLELVFEYRGPDGNDNRMATMHQVMQYSKNELIITKKVKYDGTDQFIQRHQYRFTATPAHQ